VDEELIRKIEQLLNLLKDEGFHYMLNILNFETGEVDTYYQASRADLSDFVDRIADIDEEMQEIENAVLTIHIDIPEKGVDVHIPTTDFFYMNGGTIDA